MAVFDPEARTFVINPDSDATEYTVLAVEGLAVAGAVGHDSGLSFLAQFDRFKRVDFYDGAEIVQTDACEGT